MFVRTFPVQEITTMLWLNICVEKSFHIQRKLTCQATSFNRIKLNVLNIVYILTVILKILNQVKRKCTA